MTDCKESLFGRISRLAQVHMHHDYLAVRQIRQSVSRFHFDVGYAILSAAEVPEDEMVQVLTAVLLLEQGLSIHNDVDRCEVRDRGLIVLAGDYDSSKYYLILAKLANAPLLSKLCDAVAKVNEAKMTIAIEGTALASNEYMQLMGIVQGQLLKALALHYLGQDGIWMTHIDSLVQAHVVKQELLARRKPNNFTLRQASEWLAKSMDRVGSMPGAALGSPLYSFLIEYFQPIRETVDNLHFAEGNQ